MRKCPLLVENVFFIGRECVLERRHGHAVDAGKHREREREVEGREGREGGREDGKREGKNAAVVQQDSDPHAQPCCLHSRHPRKGRRRSVPPQAT